LVEAAIFTPLSDSFPSRFTQTRDARALCGKLSHDAVPHHSTFSENRLNRFRESDILRHIFERVVIAAMGMGLVKGEGFAVDASVMEARQAVITARLPMNSIGLRSSGRSVRWLSILRHSKPKWWLKAMPQMTVRAMNPRANDSAVMSASRPR
jgi:hypothetical protein